MEEESREIDQNQPRRLNLSVGRRCFVKCPGCYSFFGNQEPDLDAILASVRQFVGMGVKHATLSGGDPLTIDRLDDFLVKLKKNAGVASIKLDTVGTSLVLPHEGFSLDLESLLGSIDQIAIPLDGISNKGATLFRLGRPRLFDETLLVLEKLDQSVSPVDIVINTVAHSGNLDEIPQIGEILKAYPKVKTWNVFQYTSTDLVEEGINTEFAVTDEEFSSLADQTNQSIGGSLLPEFWSNASRLGGYLLINSDGESWLPDKSGNTVRLGKVFGREREVLDNWSRIVQGMNSIHTIS